MAEAMNNLFAQNNLGNCKAEISHGLLARYCMDNGIEYTVRGLRNNTDYNYEENIAEANNLVYPNLKTIYIRSSKNAVSSSVVKEMIEYGEIISDYVPETIVRILKNAKIEQQKGR